MDGDSVALSTDGMGWDRILTGTGIGTRAFGMYMQGRGYMEHGYAAAAAAQFSAEQMRINASEAAAASHRTAFDIARQGQLIASKQLAVAAASGGGASDPGVLTIMARTAGENAYRSQVALYEGLSRQRQMNLAAAGEQWTGQEEKRQGMLAGLTSSIGAVSTLIHGGARMQEMAGKGHGTNAAGGTSLLDKYGGGGPFEFASNDEDVD